MPNDSGVVLQLVVICLLSHISDVRYIDPGGQLHLVSRPQPKVHHIRRRQATVEEVIKNGYGTCRRMFPLFDRIIVFPKPQSKECFTEEVAERLSEFAQSGIEPVLTVCSCGK